MPDIPNAGHGPQEYNPWGSLAEDEEANPEKRQALEESPSEPETAPEPESAPPDASRRVGATVLTRVGFESRHKAIVDSSYEQARKKGEKLPGGNTERRNYAYISRMESLIGKHGSDLEKRLWRLSVSKLVINPEEITEAYWRSQEQILRDNGQERELGYMERRLLTRDIQDKQRESLTSWSDYLGDEDTPYPMWFKMFAWDGMSKMGVFDKEKRRFAKRDEHTVAPYPKLNPAVLAKVYETMSIIHCGESSSKPLSSELTALAKSGDFNGLYSHFLLEQKSTPKTPERTEDIEGSWIEYAPGEEEALASAAEGTPWCVVSSSVGRSYLLHNEYGLHTETPEEIAAATAKSHAKFILFHLTNPETGQPSSSACASIRLDTDGNVAEISGLEDGQALEDSLVPIVEEKVKTLPGGEAFLRRFADKKQLIALDRKLQSDEELTQEELEFIYEIHRPVEQLDTYNEVDPRLIDLRAKYDAAYAIKAGLDPEKVAKAYSPLELIKNYDILTQNGVKIDATEIASRLSPYEVSDNLEFLISHNASIDLKQLATDTSNGSVASNLEIYLKYTGADYALEHLSSSEITSNIELLLKYGADANKIVANLEELWLNTYYFLDCLFKNAPNLDISLILSRLTDNSVSEFAEQLLARGADVNYIMSKMSDYQVGEKADILLNYGADPNLVATRAEFIKEHYIQTYLEHGVNPSILLAKIIILIDDNIITLFIAHNADSRELLTRILNRERIIQHIDYFLSNGVSHKEILEYFSLEIITKNLDFLLSKGFTREELLEIFSPMIPFYAEWLVAHGFDIENS